MFILEWNILSTLSIVFIKLHKVGMWLAVGVQGKK